MSESVMEPMYEAFYTHSMLRNAEAAVRCQLRVEKMLSPLDDESKPLHERLQVLPTRQILDELQSYVTFAGALARYFWPSRKKYETRAAFLRKRFGIDDSNPLANKDLRNGLEHFDERLDEYLARQDVFGIILPDYVGLSVAEGDIRGHLFRAYFIDTHSFVLFNERYELPPLIEAVIEVGKKLHDKDLNGAVLRFTPKENR
jgi:hypothetical protein